MDFLTAQKGFSQQSRAKVTQLCSSKPGCGSERAEFLGCRLPWVILATQGSFFSCLKELSADSQGRNLAWPFEHWVWSTSSQETEPQGAEKGQVKSHSSTCVSQHTKQSLTQTQPPDPPAACAGDTITEIFPKGKDIRMSSRLKCVKWEGGVVAIEEQQPLNAPEVSGCCLDAFSCKEKGRKKRGWALAEPSLHLQRKLLL